MHWESDGYNYLVRLDKGQQLVARLRELTTAQNIAGGWLSGVGGATSVELGFYHLDSKDYAWRTFDEPLEIVSLNGTLAWVDGQPALHLHGVLSDANLQTYGGHIKELTVSGTCEIFLHVWNKSQLTRSRSEQTGLNLLDI